MSIVNWPIGKALPAERTLIGAILGMVALGICLSAAPNCPGAVWCQPICVVEEPVATPPSSPRPNPDEQSRQERIQAAVRQATLDRQRQEQAIQRQRLLEEIRRRGAMAQSDVQRQQTEILGEKIDGLLDSVAAAQHENRALHQQAEAERKRLREETSKDRQIAESQRLLQQNRAEEERRKVETLSHRVDGTLDVVAAEVKQVLQTTQDAKTVARRDRKAQQQAEAQRQQAAVPPTDDPLPQPPATAGNGVSDTLFLVLGGLAALLIAAVWYTARSLKGPVDKVADGLEVAVAEVQKVAGGIEDAVTEVQEAIQATQHIEESARHERESQQERVEAQHQRFQKQVEKQLKRTETLGSHVDRTLKAVTLDADRIIQAVREMRNAPPREEPIRREQDEPKRPDVEMAPVKADIPMKVVAALSEPGTPKPVIPKMVISKVEIPEPASSEEEISEPATPEPVTPEAVTPEPAISEPAISEPAISEPAISKPARPKKAGSSKAAGFRGDRLIDDLATTVREMLDEASVRNREGDRFQAELQGIAMQESP